MATRIGVVAKFALVGIAAFFISGCGGSVRIAKQDFAAIKSVSIDPEVVLPEEPFVQGDNSTVATLFGGAVGMMIEAKSAGATFGEYLKRNNIDMRSIVKESFEKSLREKNVLPVSATSDIKLKLQVLQYGFAKSRMSVFSGEFRKPMVSVVASLVNGNSTVLWSQRDYITNLSDLTKEYTFEELAANPKLAEGSLKQASDLVANMILEQLKPE